MARALQTLSLLGTAALLLLQLLPPCTGLSLDAVREFLTREEDTIIFSLIERARYPLNRPAYDPAAYLAAGPGRRHNASFAELFVRESEAVQSKAGRYQSLQEIPFFAYRVPFTLAPPYNFTRDLHPAAALVNVNDAIWSMYFNNLLPLLAKDGDDGNYSVTVDSDLACLQALSRRINYGRFVAETKFRGDQTTYTSLIQSKDTDALMKLLTSEAQEDVVTRRVEKKAAVFGQSITLDGPVETVVSDTNKAMFKVDPSVVYNLYDQWVIPLTKQVEDTEALMKLLTSEAQEDVVTRRVEKKAAVFGQSITLDGPVETVVSDTNKAMFKVDPSVVYNLYDQWVIPLTKQVEVEYLLRRLD